MNLSMNRATLVAALVAGSPLVKQCFARLEGGRALMGNSNKPCNRPTYAVIANRAGGSVSFISEDNGDITTIEDGVTEPMYVNSANGYIFVSHRTPGADNVLVFDPDDIDKPNPKIGIFDLDIDECDGVFHQWTNGNYYVVSCVSTKSVAVIKLNGNRAKSTTYVPLTNLESGEVPHDIVINQDNMIFVTTFGAGANHIIKIDAEDGMEKKRILVGTNVDPHVALHPSSDAFLYSPQQKNGDGKVLIYDQEDLDRVQMLDVDNAHGICFSPHGFSLYVTDINGARELYAIQPRREGNGNVRARIGDMAGVVAPGGAHNCAVTESGNIYVTHSAPGAPFPNSVSLFEDDGTDLSYAEVFTTDLNPFGLAIIEGCN